MMPPVACRFCGATLHCEACDFGDQPLANNLVPMDTPTASDPRFPLRVMVCTDCLLVQLEHTVDPSVMFDGYQYLSSVSAVWRDHATRFAYMAIDRFALGRNSLVMEVGSNDGTMLRAFLARGVRCLGIDPAVNIGAEARRQGVPTVTTFFSAQTAASLRQDGQQADLLIANNVLAHAPALMDFVGGLALVLAPDGVLSIEVPHVAAMLRDAQFDTIYHEHVFYFSAFALRQIFAAAGLTIFDVETLPTHGGSLRLFAQHAEGGRQRPTHALEQVIAAEQSAELLKPKTYGKLADAATRVVDDLRMFLDQARTDRATVAAYGAAAKGTMLLNAADVSASDIVFVADGNRYKQGYRMPGCRIPIVAPEELRTVRPDFLLVLPWNIADEIMAATRLVGDWGGRFVIASPTLRVVAT